MSVLGKTHIAVYMYFPNLHSQENPEVLMKKWHEALNGTGRPMVLSNCLNNCTTIPNSWHSWCPGTNLTS
eukprot:m.55775 g.55775  ORF g.55775 m.55775 type:complete len:70 (+) comp34502_c0_seq19:1520-1729(+)